MALATTSPWSVEAIEGRVVRYADLRPCYNAFIDTRSPGSESKENFTIIGPGVSENPDQHVHIAEPHGFNIGGARQPPGCVNSQHSHHTAEVFVVNSGEWRFDLGEHGDDAQVVLHPGDVISLPTGMFRGFTNVGSDAGFLFAILGGDDPGRVLWAPQVFDMAAEFGLVLLENGSLIDTANGQSVPANSRPMPRTSPQQVIKLRRATTADAAGMVWRSAPCRPGDTTAIIGKDGPLNDPHPFRLDRLCLSKGAAEYRRTSATAEVLFVHSGCAQVDWDGGEITLNLSDTMTVPIGLEYNLSSNAEAVVYRVTGDKVSQPN